MMSPSARAGLTPAAILSAIPRGAAVLAVLHRHGFGLVLAGRGSWPPPEDVAGALQDLGPVFVKLGQVLSTRADVVPPAYRDALERLQDRAGAVPLEAVVDVFKDDSGVLPSEAFARFDPEPLASASMAQVHAARTYDGRDVVVKIQRPGLRARIEEDLGVLSQIAAAFDLAFPSMRPLDLPGLVADFRSTLRAEADFRQEARNIERFQQSLGRDESVWVPSVLPAHSGLRVLTLERSSGIRLERFLEAHPGEGPALARRLGQLFVGQVFRDGLFHADPHPGNFFVLADGRLCLHDFGMIGELDERLREALVNLVRATVAGDGRLAAQAYMDMGLLPADVDRRSVEQDVSNLIAEIRSAPLRDVSVGAALEALVRLGGGYRIRHPGAFLLLARAFLTLEGLLARLDPELAFTDVFGGAFRSAVERRFRPEQIRDDLVGTLNDLDHLARKAPGDARRLLESLARGELGRAVVDTGAVTRQAEERRARALRRTLAGGGLTLTGALLLTGGAGGVALLGWGVLAAGFGLLILGGSST